MNDIKPLVVFSADFPNDATETNGEVVKPAGRNILEAICQKIAATGIATKQPTQHSFYGWTANFVIDRVKIWLLLQQPGPWLLIVEARPSWFAGNTADSLRKGIALLDDVLKADTRIKDAQWMTKHAFESLSQPLSESQNVGTPMF